MTILNSAKALTDTAMPVSCASSTSPHRAESTGEGISSLPSPVIFECAAWPDCGCPDGAVDSHCPGLKAMARADRLAEIRRRNVLARKLGGLPQYRGRDNSDLGAPGENLSDLWCDANTQPGEGLALPLAAIASLAVTALLILWGLI